MIYICTVVGCSNKSITKGVRLYRFPDDKKLHERWIKALNFEFVPDKNFRICSAHFTSDDFEPLQGKKKRRMLKSGAVPSVFPKPSSHRSPGDTCSDGVDEPNASGSNTNSQNISSNLIDLTIKTLDAQDHKFKVPEAFTVLELKQHIADRVNIAINKQRLIFFGRVLSNETILADIGVDGKVLHLAQRVPKFTTLTTPSTTINTNRPGQNAETNSRRVYDEPYPMMSEPREILPPYSAISERVRALELRRQQNIRNCTNERFELALFNIEKGNEILSRLENAQIINRSSANDLEQFPQGSSQQAKDASRNSLLDSGLMHHVQSHLQPNNSIIPSPNSSQQYVESEAASLPETTTIEPTNQSSAEQNARPLPFSATSEQNSRNDSQIPENMYDAAKNDRRQFNVLIEQLCKLNARLQPFFSLFCQYVNVDSQFEFTEGENGSQRAQFVYNGVSEVLHYVSHTIHLISDLRIAFNGPPPRSFQSDSHIFHNNTVGLFTNSTRLPSPFAASTQTTTLNNTPPFGIAILVGIPETAGNQLSNISPSVTNTSSNLNTNTENSNASAAARREALLRMFSGRNSLSSNSSESNQSTTDPLVGIPGTARNQTPNVSTSVTNTSSNLNTNTENSNSSAAARREALLRMFSGRNSLSSNSSVSSTSTTDSLT